MRALRSALVGAGVLLATSLLISISELSGITGQIEQRLSASVMAILGAVIAAAADFFGARRERPDKPGKEDDQ